MKPALWFFCSFFFICLAGLGFAASADPVLVEPTIQEWLQFLASLKGVHGLGALGIAGLTVQGLLYAFRSRFVTLSGKQKLIAVQVLSTIAGIIGLRLQGADFVSSLVHANTLGAIQVFAHQVYKQFTDPGDKYILPSV